MWLAIIGVIALGAGGMMAARLGAWNGLPVMSVSEVLSEREAGGLKNTPVAVGGYWSAVGLMIRSCPIPHGTPGVLELQSCEDAGYGITELDEPFLSAVGPKLMPYIYDLFRARQLVHLPLANGQPAPPIPIVAVGHFDDRRAADCQPRAREFCLDRLVLDRILQFGP